MLVINTANHQISRLIVCLCGNFKQHWIAPKTLSRIEVDAMLHTVGLALGGVEFKRMKVYKLNLNWCIYVTHESSALELRHSLRAGFEALRFFMLSFQNIQAAFELLNPIEHLQIEFSQMFLHRFSVGHKQSGQGLVQGHGLTDEFLVSAQHHIVGSVLHLRETLP